MLLRRTFAAMFAAILAVPVLACDTALVLAIDVSNSIDVAEYRLQADGLAAALADPEVIDVMVTSNVALAVVQWSGEDRQVLSIPWTRIKTPLDAQIMAAQARTMERAIVLSDTAPAEAIYFSMGLFADVPDCKRQVIDVSGDGTPNSGGDVRLASRAAERAGITINGIAIEGMGVAITSFFSRTLVTRNGFVITAMGHRNYAAAIRSKILRELAQVFG